MNNRACFTAFILRMIKNESINYKKHQSYINKIEEQFSDENNLGIQLIDLQFYLSEDKFETINYETLERVFSQKKYYNAMKKLKKIEKLILYLTILEQQPIKKIAHFLHTNENNISKIKHRAKNKFIKNIELEVM